MELPIGFGIEGDQPIHWVIIIVKKLYGINDAGLKCFDKINEGMEARGFVQSQLYPCVWYR